jgi:superkiller protein 3
MRRVFAVLIGVACGCAAPAHAQGRDGFARALVDVINAVNEPDPRKLTVAIDSAAAALQDWDAAIARAEAGLARDVTAAPPPVAAGMRATLGLLYLIRGRAGDALAQFDLAAKIDGVPADVHALRGWALRATGRPADAAAAFLRAFLSDPADPAKAYLALHHGRATGKPAPATGKAVAAVLAAESALLAGPGGPLFLMPALLDDGAADRPILPPSRYAKGFALIQQGRYDDALAVLRVAASVGMATDDRVELARVDSLVTAGLLDEAEQGLRAVVERFPDAGQAYWHWGRLYMRLNREADALAQFERAARLNPIAGAAPLHVIVGQLHENQLDPDAALRAFERAIDVNPNHAPAHRELAEALVGLDRLDEARAEFLIALRLDAGDAVAWSGLGQVHAAQERLDQAVAAFQRAVAIDARNREAHYGLARAFTRLGRAEEGSRELEIFERLQAEAMAEQRRRFEDNLRRIQQLRDTTPAGAQP